MHIKKYNEYSSINEEFIGKLIKGALSGLSKIFTDPFKDLVSDVKSTYKEDKPSSIKDIILSNFNQAIDGVQKELLKTKDETVVTGLMTQLISSLTELSNGLGTDFTTAIGKDKVNGPLAVAKAIIVGFPDIKWDGIVGLLSGKQNYKFSKINYDKAIASQKDLESKKKTANTFLENLQKDIVTVIDRELSDDELTKIFNDNATKVKSDYKIGDVVKYKMDGYDVNKKEEEQKNLIGIGKIIIINGNTISIDTGKSKFDKPLSSIIGKNEGGQNAKDVANSLGKIKGDEEKMGDVATYSDFIQNPVNKDKIDQINKIIKGE